MARQTRPISRTSDFAWLLPLIPASETVRRGSAQPPHRAVEQFWVMHIGSSDTHGTPSNEGSATCRFQDLIEGSNPSVRQQHFAIGGPPTGGRTRRKLAADRGQVVVRLQT